jgi:hypothetical protein
VEEGNLASRGRNKGTRICLEERVISCPLETQGFEVTEAVERIPEQLRKILRDEYMK